MRSWHSGWVEISGVGLGAQFFLLTALISEPILSAEWLPLSVEHEQCPGVRALRSLQHVIGR